MESKKQVDRKKVLKEVQRKQVEEILLTPIICQKRNKVIFIDNGVIQTNQRYIRSADEDMSNFAVDFYNIVYGDVIPTKSILDGKYLTDKNFAGDTINSYRSIAKLVDFENCDICIRKMIEEYYNFYHCLANFWVLPMKIGRQLPPKLNSYDSLDIFLEKINSEEKYNNEIGTKYYSYGQEINYNNFKKIHFIQNYREEKDDGNRYKHKEVEILIKRAKKMIENRALEISNSDKAVDLYLYFCEKKLIKSNQI